MRRRRKGHLQLCAKGFTMMELLMAIFVVTVGVLGMLMANTLVQRTSRAAYERMVATQDAHRVIELMRNASATGTFPSNVTSAYPEGAAVGGFTNLSKEQVTVTYASPTADPLDVTVTSNWSELGVRNTSMQLRTLITKRT